MHVKTNYVKNSKSLLIVVEFTYSPFPTGIIREKIKRIFKFHVQS